MGKVVEVVLKFVKYFICKWFGTKVLEKIVIIFLEELVKRTDSKLDDKIYKAVFEDMDRKSEV